VNGYTLEYGTTTIRYELVYGERKTLGIDVTPEQRVVVKAPAGTPLAEIERRLRKRAPWILRQQREFEGYPPTLPPRRYVSGESHRYLGKQYRLKVVEAKKELVKLTRGRFLVQVRDKGDSSRVKRLLESWYRRQAQRVYQERLELCYPRVKRYGIPYPELTIKRMEQRWGSCTPEGRITLNLKLIQVPKPYIDYVILHELCHMKEHHHGAAFYALLGKVLPDWGERREGLNLQELS